MPQLGDSIRIRMPEPVNIWAEASEVANEVLDAFSQLHPSVRMNMPEWHDLKEMIEREIVGRFGENAGAVKPLVPRAKDLLGV